MRRAPVSVIVPTLNEAGVIDRLLADLRPLRRCGWEVVVVDGGSADDTVERARRGADMVLNSSPGRARQMNVGAEQAIGDVLWFVHADSGIPATATQQLQAAIAEGCAWGRFDVQLSGAHPLFRWIERSMAWRSRLTGIATGDQAIFVRHDWFTAVGGFPVLPLMEDIAISRRLRARAWPRCLSARIRTSSRRWERRGIVRTVLLMWRLRLQYFLGVPAERLAQDYRQCGESEVRCISELQP